MSRKRHKKKIGKTGCLFWLLVLLIIIVILVYKGKGSLKDTAAFIKNGFSRQQSQKETYKKPSPSVKTPESQNKSYSIKEKTEETASQKTKKIPSYVEKQPVLPKIENSRTQKKAAPRTTIKSKTIRSSIYFVKIELNGSAKLLMRQKNVTFKDSPITKTIDVLLQGPSPAEKKKGIVTFIPDGTRLLSADIKSGHLTLNFNHVLEENYSGREAISFEISQILLTAFEFQTVSTVTILIDGRFKQYITGEGILLKKTYQRQDLTQLMTEA